MAALQLTVRHVDTCLPCYVLDHCNGDTETLIGAPVDGATTNESLMADLICEALQSESPLPDFSGDEMRAAIADCFADATPSALFDSSLDNTSDDDDDGESVFAWFRFSWESDNA